MAQILSHPDEQNAPMPLPLRVTHSSARFEELPIAARVIWAKSAADDDLPGHGLLAHMLDVAAVAERLLARESIQTLVWAANGFGVAPAGAARWIAAMVGLHDLGKATAGFQDKWPAGRAADADAGLTFNPIELLQDQHDLASAVELRRLLGPWADTFHLTIRLTLRAAHRAVSHKPHAAMEWSALTGISVQHDRNSQY